MRPRDTCPGLHSCGQNSQPLLTAVPVSTPCKGNPCIPSPLACPLLQTLPSHASLLLLHPHSSSPMLCPPPMNTCGFQYLHQINTLSNRTFSPARSLAHPCPSFTSRGTCQRAVHTLASGALPPPPAAISAPRAPRKGLLPRPKPTASSVLLQHDFSHPCHCQAHPGQKPPAFGAHFSPYRLG